ncbi:MAG: LptF/LptG family permease [Planctomycetota bacterium]
MTIIDRYLSWLFLKTLLICFVSFAGLFVVVHLFSNLDELTLISQQIGWTGVFQEFYLPRFADLYDKSAGIVILVAAIFSVSLLQRRREMTALEANGLTKARILRSVFILAIIFVVLSVLNRELLIPQLKEKLVHTPQSWGDEGAVDMKVHSDLANGIVLRGDQLLIQEKKISDIDVQMPLTIAGVLPRVKAKYGIVTAADDRHPEGIWLHQVEDPDRLLKIGSLEVEEGKTIFFSQSDQAWLGPNQCFVRCTFDVDEMAYGNQLAAYRSTKEMIDALREPATHTRSTRKNKVAVHARIVKPILDLTLLLLGLPMVIGGIERNVFVSAGVCFWIIIAVQLTAIVSYALGTSSLIQPAALAAWLPVLIYVPLAAVALRRLKR